VRLSVTRRYCIQTGRGICRHRGFHRPIMVCREIRGYSRNKVTSLWNVAETLELENLDTQVRSISDSRQSVKLTAPGDDGGRGQARHQQLTDDRHLLITLGVQFCVQRDGRLSAKHRRAGPTDVSRCTCQSDE